MAPAIASTTSNRGDRAARVRRRQVDPGKRHQARQAVGRGVIKDKEMTRTSKFDVADCLKTPELIAAYLTEVLETGDTAFVCAALNTIARAKGMANVAKATGLGRESLYKSLSGTTKAEFDTIREGREFVWCKAGGSTHRGREEPRLTNPKSGRPRLSNRPEWPAP